MILTRASLDTATCQKSGCTHEHDDELWFHSKCHPADPTWARYYDGVVTVVCAGCYRDVAQIAVADGWHRGREDPARAAVAAGPEEEEEREEGGTQ